MVEATHDTDATEIQALVVRGEFLSPTPTPRALLSFPPASTPAHAPFHFTVTTHALLRLVRWEFGVGGGLGAMRHAIHVFCTHVVQVADVETSARWLARVGRILTSGDDVDALRDVVGTHGRRRAPDGRHVWVFLCGGTEVSGRGWLAASEL